jgi:hypothetical protein
LRVVGSVDLELLAEATLELKPVFQLEGLARIGIPQKAEPAVLARSPVRSDTMVRKAQS